MANPSERRRKPAKPIIAKGVRGLLRGQISIATAAREAFRRGRAIARGRRERAKLEELAARPLELHRNVASLTPTQLLEHFRKRESPSFLPGFQFIDHTVAAQNARLPAESEQLLHAAKMILEHRWPLLGFGEKNFGPEINWLRDPLSNRIWPTEYHRDIVLWHNDGSDIRVLWEFNRLGHFITLARAYALTNDESFAAEFFEQLEAWQKQNPLGRGPNWACAMEVALRSINLLNAFAIFRKSPALTEARLLALLQLFEQSGEHIQRNLEFSYISTSNHYLSDVVGLLWMGILLPELSAAPSWLSWALGELSNEIDKQVLSDGADYEGSTSYHAFVLELLLCTLVLLETNGIVDHNYRGKLRAMLDYLQTIMRPDQTLPLIGDVDGGRLVSIGSRKANDRAYLSSLGAVIFKDPSLKRSVWNAEEVLWVLGKDGLALYETWRSSDDNLVSRPFPDIGAYVMRHEDLYLLFNANAVRPDRPVSHRHNDLLNIEVFAGGRAFIIDPGSFVYTADLNQRKLFRSTAYHSTITIDDSEQQTISDDQPFAIDGEAHIFVQSWESTIRRDFVVAEHTAYQRLSRPATHRRSVTFDKAEGWWLVEDQISGTGLHKVETRFHFNSGLNVSADGPTVFAQDENGVTLCVYSLGTETPPILEAQFTSIDYGEKQSSTTACWTNSFSAPVKLRWAIVPVRRGEDLEGRLEIVKNATSTQTLDFGH